MSQHNGTDFIKIEGYYVFRFFVMSLVMFRLILAQ